MHDPTAFLQGILLLNPTLFYAEMTTKFSSGLSDHGFADGFSVKIRFPILSVHPQVQALEKLVHATVNAMRAAAMPSNQAVLQGSAPWVESWFVSEIASVYGNWIRNEPRIYYW